MTQPVAYLKPFHGCEVINGGSYSIWGWVTARRTSRTQHAKRNPRVVLGNQVSRDKETEQKALSQFPLVSNSPLSASHGNQPYVLQVCFTVLISLVSVADSPCGPEYLCRVVVWQASIIQWCSKRRWDFTLKEIWSSNVTTAVSSPSATAQPRWHRKKRIQKPHWVFICNSDGFRTSLRAGEGLGEGSGAAVYHLGGTSWIRRFLPTRR